MPTRRPIPTRPTPTRWPPPRRGAPQLPWGVMIGGALVLLAVLIVGGILLWPRLGGGARVTPTARTTPDAVATAVAATVQAMATIPTGSTPAPGATATLPSAPATPTPGATPVLPTLEPSIQVNVQRDPEVDAITGIATWTEPAAQSEIRVLLRRADGALLNRYVTVHPQGADVSGNPVQEGRAVLDKWTGDSAGIVTAAVAPGTYIVNFSIDGWPWTAQFANHVVSAGQRTNVLFDVSLLTVGLRYADGSPVDKYVSVHLQATDVSGLPVEGNTVESGWTGEDGLITFELTPGVYALQATDIGGYDTWGRFDHNVPGGGVYTVVLTLGRLDVETWNADGTLATDVYVQVYKLVPDSRGVSVFGRSVVSRFSDNTGKAAFDLTPGFYGVKIGNDLDFVDVPVQSGQTTTVNRSGYVVP